MGLASNQKDEKASERRSRSAARQQQSDSEFVNLELSLEEKAALRVRYASFSDFDTDFERLLEVGTKVTTKYDERNRCYVCFAFPGEDSDNAGYILTGRGGSASRACRELLFKHCVLLDGDWPSYHNRSGADLEGDDW